MVEEQGRNTKTMNEKDELTGNGVPMCIWRVKRKKLETIWPIWKKAEINLFFNYFFKRERAQVRAEREREREERGREGERERSRAHPKQHSDS